MARRVNSGPDYALERHAHRHGSTYVAGVDEAGRGPLAGPVVAAAVVLDSRNIPAGLNDSKQLAARRRAELYDHILAGADVAVGIVDAARVDEINVLAATMQAMAAALDGLKHAPDLALVDGNRAPDARCACHSVIRGDTVCASIAAASIVAKVTRDAMMDELDRAYPVYGFAQHKGYGTAGHLDALRAHGPCPAHRRSFAPVRKLLDLVAPAG